jgi:membrane peptidoglycan carboxypeptidase
MQLVKNVYLSRQKTIARKLEEILIVWLIENNHLTSKRRMFEVYLNIIEWAPNVYGIGEASRFYFSKSPAYLTVGESIFLASIVPKPKKYRYSFTPSGELRPYMRNYFRLIGGLMVRRGKIMPEDTLNMFNSFELNGPAKSYVVVDTVKTVEEDEGNFFKRLFDSFRKKDDGD